MKINETTAFTLLLIPLFFLWSYSLLHSYINGDQFYYHIFFDALRGSPLNEAMSLANMHVSSKEPLSAFVLWIGANLNIDKNIFISIINVIFLIGLFLITRKLRIPLFPSLLIFSNFYLIVLMTGAERLKISYIFLTYAFLMRGIWRNILILISPLAHLQSCLLVFSIFLVHVSDKVNIFIKKFSLSTKNFNIYIVNILLFLVMLYFFREILFKKAMIYMNNQMHITEITNISLLLIVSLIVLKDKFKTILSFFPLIVAVVILGGQRVNMIAVTLLFILCISEKRLKHQLIILLLTYFSLKSIPFVYNIYHNGDGFDGWLF